MDDYAMPFRKDESFPSTYLPTVKWDGDRWALTEFGAGVVGEEGVIMVCLPAADWPCERHGSDIIRLSGTCSSEDLNRVLP